MAMSNGNAYAVTDSQFDEVDGVLPFKDLTTAITATSNCY